MFFKKRCNYLKPHVLTETNLFLLAVIFTTYESKKESLPVQVGSGLEEFLKILLRGLNNLYIYVYE